MIARAARRRTIRRDPQRRAAVCALLPICLGAWVCMGVSCKTAPDATQVMLVIDAEPEVRGRIRDLELVVESGEGDVSKWGERFSGSLTQGSAAVAWPVEVALVPRKGKIDDSYLVVVTARGQDHKVIAQLRAISGYIAGKSLSLPLLFDVACLQRDELCSPELTCRAGGCIDPYIPAAKLLPFKEDRPPAVTVEASQDAGGSPDDAEGGTAVDMRMDAGNDSMVTQRDAGSDQPSGCEVEPDRCEPPDPPDPIECPDAVCEGCPDGFAHAEGNSQQCVPLLTGLAISRGEIVPALNATDTRYRIELPLLAADLALTPLVGEGVHLELNGEVIDPSLGYRLPNLPLGETTLVASLSHDDYGSRTYTFTIVRQGSQRSYLKAPNTRASDGFGVSLAASQDTIVVGAIGEDSAATDVDGDVEDDGAQDSGAAYVFVREGQAWTLQAYLKPSTSSPGAHFGYSVAISGDTIVVGAPDRGAGSVYVFTRSGTQWSAQAQLDVSGLASDAAYGKAVAVLGDTVAVGAPGVDLVPSSAGVVYVFARDAGSWSSGVRVVPPSPQSYGWFGTSLALEGDTLAIGATGESFGDAISNGAAYVFTRDDSGQYTFDARLLAELGGDADFLGEYIAVDGDTVVVGATGASPTAIASGAAYVFERDQQGFHQQARLSAGNPTADAHFGLRVALAGDVLLSSAADDDSSAQGVNGDLTGTALTDSGAAYVFTRRDGVFTQLAMLKADLPGAGDHYGSALALVGDSIVVSAYSEASSATGIDGNPDDDGAPGSGAVYVVR